MREITGEYSLHSFTTIKTAYGWSVNDQDQDQDSYKKSV